MRHQRVGRSLGPDLVGRPAESQGFALRKKVRHQQVMLLAKRIVGTTKADEVARYATRSLVQQLIERVLAVGTGFTPHHRRRLEVDSSSIDADALAIALHHQ